MNNDAICGDLRSAFNLDKISNDKFLGGKCHSESSSASVDCDLLVVLLSCLQLLELFFLHVVVSCCDSHNDAYCKEDGCAFDPSVAPPVVDDTDNSRHKGSKEQDPQHEVFETLEDQLQERLGLSETLGVLTIDSSALLKVRKRSFDSILN